MANLEPRVELLEEAVLRLTAIAEDHTTMLTNQTTILTNQQELLEELRRDVRHTQRLWTRLAQKNGWLDDDDLA